MSSVVGRIHIFPYKCSNIRKFTQKNENISEIDILTIRAKLWIIFSDLNKCYTDTSYTRPLTNFLNQNPNIMLVPHDKSKNLTFIYRDEYITKLNNTFSDQTKFTILAEKDSNISKIVTQYNVIRKTMEPYLSKSEYWQISALESHKKSFGSLKVHKENAPLRPIVSSIGSVTEGAERYLQKVIRPLEEMCTLTVNSTKMFKNVFMENRNKYVHENHEIFTIDVVSLFTNVNCEMVIKYIVDQIYKSPKKFFGDDPHTKNNLGTLKRTPPKPEFRRFLTQILTEFNQFSSLDGYVKQPEGLSMGSKLSPTLANIYLGIMEKDIIQNQIKNGNICMYSRYVDDIFIVTKKDQKENILNAMNNF